MGRVAASPYPTRFQGSPVSTWPRANSARPKAIATANTLARARAPQDRGKRRSRRIRTAPCRRRARHGEGDEPAVTPGLDQKGFGGPIKTGEEIAEAEPESDERGASGRVPSAVWSAWHPSSSQTSRPKLKNSTGQTCKRGKGEHGDGAREGRERSALPPLQRRDPLGCRLHGRRKHSAALGRWRFGWRLFALLGAMDAQLLDAARIGIQHLELDAARVAHQLAARRDAAGKREHEAADGVDVLFLLRRDELDAEMPREILDRRSGIGDRVRASGLRGSSLPRRRHARPRSRRPPPRPGPRWRRGRRCRHIRRPRAQDAAATAACAAGDRAPASTAARREFRG